MPAFLADDLSLLTGIAHGDEPCLVLLYERYRLRLWRFTWNLVHGNTAMAEEVLQDTFVHIWLHAHDFRGTARVSTWIFQIAHHTAQTTWRNAHRQKDGYILGRSPSSLEALVDDEVTVPSHENAVIDHLTFAEAFTQLSQPHQEVLELVLNQGFTVEETAQILNIPAGTVKSRLSYARRALSHAITTGQQQQPEESHHAKS